MRRTAYYRTNFREAPTGEVRRISLPRTPVYKGKKRKGRVPNNAPPLPTPLVSLGVGELAAILSGKLPNLRRCCLGTPNLGVVGRVPARRQALRPPSRHSGE